MSNNRTFAIIKPDAVQANYSGSILQIIEENGFKILALKMTRLNLEQAGRFYEVHKERPFYQDLCSYMTSGLIIAVVLKQEDAVKKFRELIGNTDPKKADIGTIRNLFATSIEANAIHGSDSDENASLETSFFFANSEIHN